MNDTTKVATRMCHQLARVNQHPHQYSVLQHYWVRLLSSHIKPKKITFWAMLGMRQLLNMLTFGILFPWTKVLLPYVHATFVYISTICESKCFECIFMTINWFHPILFKFFYRYLKFQCYFWIFVMFFP